MSQVLSINTHSRTRDADGRCLALKFDGYEMITDVLMDYSRFMGPLGLCLICQDQVLLE